MKNKKGFTLVELAVTIVIIIVLSSISVPLYKGYVKDAKMAEGYVLLSTIKSAQQTYYTRYGNFLNLKDSSGSETSNETVLGIDARTNKYFTLLSVGSAIDNKSKFYFECSVRKPKELQKNNKTSLAIQYNLTRGYKTIEYPAEYDSSWYQI